MSLPKLNVFPQYECKVPSSGKVLKFRPFLVKEQKVLLIALESQDTKEMARAILNTVESCFSDVKVSELTTFDVDYMFAQLRGKSVGETATFRAPCSKCGEYSEAKVRVDDIDLGIEGEIKNDYKIDLAENLSIILKYPSYELLLTKGNTDLTGVDSIFETILMCIDTVLTEDDRIVFKEEPEKECIEFIESLSPTQLKQILEFVNNIPRVSHKVTFECESCSEINTQEIQGLENFF